MKKWLKIWICFVFVSGVIGAAYAQFDKPEVAIAYRKAVMTLIGQHFGRLAAVVKGKQPYDRDEFARNAALVETFSKLPWEAFMVPGTDKGATRLKPEAFRQPAKFKEDEQKMQAEVTKLVREAAGGNFDNIKAQFGQVAGACKRCHDQFRAR